MDLGVESIGDVEEAAAVRQKGRHIVLKSLAATVLATTVAVLLP